MNDNPPTAAPTAAQSTASCANHQPFKTFDNPQDVINTIDNQKRYCLFTNRGKNLTFNLNGRQNLALHRFTQYCGDKGILLMHSVGSGKTLTSISMALSCFDWTAQNPAVRRQVIIVAPSGLYQNFIDDLMTNVPSAISKIGFENGHLIRIRIGPNPNDLRNLYLKPIKYSEITGLYCQTELEFKNLELLFENSVVIFDEAHRLFRPAGNAFTRLSLLDVMINYKSLILSKRYIVMTGTPYNSEAQEIVKMAQFIELAGTIKPIESSEYKKLNYIETNKYLLGIQGIMFFQNVIMLGLIKPIVNIIPGGRFIRGNVTKVKEIMEWIRDFKMEKKYLIDFLFYKGPFIPRLKNEKKQIEQTGSPYIGEWYDGEANREDVDDEHVYDDDEHVYGYDDGEVNVAVAQVNVDPVSTGLFNTIIGWLQPNNIQGGMKINDAYKILQLPPTATIKNLKIKYRELSLKYHPDRCVEKDKPECEKKFKQMQEAYNSLLCKLSDNSAGQNCESSQLESDSDTISGKESDSDTISGKTPLTYGDYRQIISQILINNLESENITKFFDFQSELLFSDEFQQYITNNESYIDIFLEKFCKIQSLPEVLTYTLTLNDNFSINQIGYIKNCYKNEIPFFIEQLSTNIPEPTLICNFEYNQNALTNVSNKSNEKSGGRKKIKGGVGAIDKVFQSAVTSLTPSLGTAAAIMTVGVSSTIGLTAAAYALYKYLYRDTGLGHTLAIETIKYCNFEQVINYNKISKEILKVTSPIDVNMLPVSDSFTGIKKQINDSIINIPGLCDTNLDIISDNITTQEKIGFNYPDKQVHVIYIEYTGEQQMFFSQIESYITNQAKWWSSYTINPGDPRNGLQRCVGNYSTDLDVFTSVYKSGTTPIGFYPTFEHTIAGINSRIPLNQKQTDELRSFDEKIGKFSCPKFQKMFLHLLLMKTGLMFSKDGLVEQPHLTNAIPKIRPPGTGNQRNYYFGDDDYDTENWPSTVGVANDQGLYTKNPFSECTHYYLPLVYSCSDKLGINLFASYIKSYGFDFVILNKDDDKEERLEREKIRAVKKVYKLFPNDIRRTLIDALSSNIYSSKKSTFEELFTRVLEIINTLPEEIRLSIVKDPICVFLTPDMTEGLDCKFNPAILLMEPPNNYGDYDQLCGRVLRTYSKPYVVAPQKMIYQFVCFNYENLENIYNDRAWSKQEIQPSDRIFYDDDGYISNELKIAFENRKELFSDFAPKNVLGYIFRESLLTWKEYINLYKLWIKNKTLDILTRGASERAIIGQAINKQFQMRNLKPNEQITLFDTLIGGYSYKMALYNSRTIRNQFALKEFIRKFNFVTTSQEVNSLKTLSFGEQQQQFVDSFGIPPSKEDITAYDKALLELQNNIIESKSPDLDRLQSIQRVEFFVNLIKSELCKPASLPDLEIIKKCVEKSGDQNLKYLPWCQEYFKDINKSCHRLNLSNNPTVSFTNQQQYNASKEQFITHLQEYNNNKNNNNIAQVQGYINTLITDINDINSTITIQVNGNPIVINPIPLQQIVQGGSTKRKQCTIKKRQKKITKKNNKKISRNRSNKLKKRSKTIRNFS